MSKKKPRMSKRTYTKIAMTWILRVSLICILLSYVLAFMGREQIAEVLSSKIVEVVLGAFFIYCAKSYFETNAEEKIKLQREELGLNTDDTEM